MATGRAALSFEAALELDPGAVKRSGIFVDHEVNGLGRKPERQGEFELVRDWKGHLASFGVEVAQAHETVDDKDRGPAVMVPWLGGPREYGD
jgi:hypothetical protein